MFQISTGLRNHLLATGGLKGGLDGMVIRVYDDSIVVPDSPNDTVAGATLLCLLTVNGDDATGFTLDATPVGGIISKTSSESVYGTIITGGTAAFFRISTLADDNTASTTALRCQGTVGKVGADFLVSDTVFVSGEIQRADSMNIGMPESA